MRASINDASRVSHLRNPLYIIVTIIIKRIYMYMYIYSFINKTVVPLRTGSFARSLPSEKK